MVKPFKTQLSDNFYYEEYFISDDYPELAQKTYDKECDNEEYIKRLKHHALCIAQPFRSHVDDIVEFDSGVRDVYLNKAVGGSSTSDHMFAMAGDMFVPKYIDDMEAMKELYIWATKNLNYRQLIWYPQSGTKFIHGAINWAIDEKPFKREAKVQWNGKYILADEFFRKNYLDN